jgi:hypothetical protein
VVVQLIPSEVAAGLKDLIPQFGLHGGVSREFYERPLE